MRLVVLSLAASLVAATPAFANEIRAEARGGVIWSAGDSEATAGVAAGYDYDLAKVAFVGAEVSADKILTSNTRVSFGFSGRVGAKALGSKLYAVGGYATKPCALCEGQWNLGAGVERGFLGKFYGKVEYRHFFEKNGQSDADSVVAGLGVKF